MRLRSHSKNSTTEKTGESSKVSEDVDQDSLPEQDDKVDIPVEEKGMPAEASNEGQDAGGSSSSRKKFARSPSKLSARKVCINLLETEGLLLDTKFSAEYTSLEALGGDDPDFFLQCNTCSAADNPLGMLVCDLCQEAYHLECCNEVEPVEEDWLCQTCLEEKPQQLLSHDVWDLFKNLGILARRKVLLKKMGQIPFMLKDMERHVSRVRIGDTHQAEVPEWAGPEYDERDYNGEPSAVDPAEFPNLNGKFLEPALTNWIQCTEDECWKWRRAPRSARQTDEWDCSCAVVWDPYHADCRVPQEAEEKEVLRQLKSLGLEINRKTKKKHQKSKRLWLSRKKNSMPL